MNHRVLRSPLALVILLLLTVAPQVSAQTASDGANRQYAAAVGLQNNEVYDLAAEEWAKFIEKHPQDDRIARAHHYRGVCLLKSDQLDAALAAFELVLADYPEFELLESTYLNLGVTRYTQARSGAAEAYDQAAATFATLLEKYPEGKNSALALYYQGEALYARDKKGEAAASYAALVERFPDAKLAPDALYALGVTQQELGQDAEAGGTYVTFLQRFPEHALATEVSMRQGQALFAAGNYAEAMKLFAAAANKEGFAHADYSLLQQAACLSAVSKHAQAAVVYASLVTKFPQSQYLTPALLEGGKCAYLAGDLVGARNALSKVQAGGGASAGEAAHWIARSWLKEQKPAEALKVVEQALPQAADGPFAAQLLLDQADALYEIPDRRAETPPLYAAVASRFPEDAAAPQALYMAGFAALGQGDYQSALTHAEAYLQRHAVSPLAPDVMFVAAESHLQLTQYDRAGAFYARLLEEHADHADAEQWKVRRGLALHLEKKHPEALAALTGVIETLKSPALIAEARYLMGVSQAELGESEEAIASYRASLAADPAWRQADETMLALAAAQKLEDALTEAQATLRALLEKFPDSPVQERAHYRLGEAAYAAGDFPSAAREYRLVLDQWPAGSLADYSAFGLGWSELSQSRHAEAAAAFTALLDKYPQSTLTQRARYARALARQQLKEYAPAVEDLRAYLAGEISATERSDARYVLGLSLAGLMQPAEAALEYQAILTDDPAYAGADKVYYELAWAMKDQGLEADAAAAFGQLTEKFPESPLAGEAAYHLGESHYVQAGQLQKDGQAEAALAEFKLAAAAYFAAMKQAGETDLGEKAVHKLGWAQYRQEQFDKAQVSFNYQRATWPQGPLAGDAAFMLGESLFKQDKFEEALAAYQQVQNPAGKDFAALALLHGGQSAGRLEQWQQSLELLTKLTETYPESDYLPEAFYEQAWAQQNLGATDAALDLYEAVTARTEREVAARARFMIGEIYFGQKDHKEAVRNFFKAAYGYSYPEWQANAHFEAGRCLEVLGKTQQAISSYKEVVEKHPASDKAPLAQARLDELGG